MLEIDDWCKLFTSIYSANKKNGHLQSGRKNDIKGNF